SEPQAVYKWTGGAITEHWSESETGVEVRNRIRIRPNSKASSGIWYRIAANYSIVTPREYSDVIAFGAPVIGVTVYCDSPNFDFSAADATRYTKDRWEFDTLFLGGEHIRVRWEPKALSTPPASK